MEVDANRGRARRPLIVVKNGRPEITEEHMKKVILEAESLDILITHVPATDGRGIEKPCKRWCPRFCSRRVYSDR